MKLEWLILYIRLKVRTQRHKSIHYLVHHWKERGQKRERANWPNMNCHDFGIGEI